MHQKIMPFERLASGLNQISYKSRTCYYQSCLNSPDISHTISENYLYKLNSDLTKVLTVNPKISEIVDKMTPQYLKPVDTKEFITFIGFCNKHDHDLFKLIDSFDGKMNNAKATLVHYRNICYGISHIKTEQKKLTGLTKQNYVDDESSTPEIKILYEKLKRGDFAPQLESCLKEHETRKEQLEQMIISQNFNQCNYIEVLLPFPNPIFSGRSQYMLHEDDKFQSGYSYMPWITYMTLLTANSNHLIFCWLENDKDKINILRDSLSSREEKKFIDVLAYTYSDGFALEDSFYKKNCSVIDKLMKSRKY